MIPQKRKIFIVLVHYGDTKPTYELVRALSEGEKTPEEIVVVDHGPAESHVNFQQKNITVIHPEKNEGYAAGLNVGIGVLLARDVKPLDLLVCFNNDVQAALGTLTQIDAWWNEHPDVALAGTVMGFVNLFTGRAVIEQKNKKYARWQIPYVHGALLAGPFNVFSKIGFPDQQFMYWEDVIFSLRVRQRGIPLEKMTGITAIHNNDKGAADPQKTYYLVRNGAIFLETKTPPFWRVYWRILNRLRYVHHRFFSRDEIGRVVTKALDDARKRVKGKVVL